MTRSGPAAPLLGRVLGSIEQGHRSFGDAAVGDLPFVVGSAGAIVRRSAMNRARFAELALTGAGGSEQLVLPQGPRGSDRRPPRRLRRRLLRWGCSRSVW